MQVRPFGVSATHRSAYAQYKELGGALRRRKLDDEQPAAISTSDSHLRPRTVFICDPQIPFRVGLRAMLERAAFEVVGEAAHARSVVESVAALGPALCLIGGDDESAVLATSRLVAACPDLRVVVLADEITGDGLLAVVLARACGYVPRETTGAGIVRVAEAVLRGEYAVPRRLVGRLVDEVRRDGREHRAIDGVLVSLTEREAQVAKLLQDGLTTLEIAASLGLSPVTVRRYVGSIGQKSGQQGRRRLLEALRAA